MYFLQKEFQIRMEWGIQGLKNLIPISDVIVIIDILSFSTCVDIATNNGAYIFPYQYKDESAKQYAKNRNAILADSKRKFSDGFSLSPSSLVHIKPKTKLVLPSPNGSTLSLFSKKKPTICGSFRNARVVAEYAQGIGKNITIIPAGEKWEDGTLRVGFEDLMGAGSIISYLKGDLSPESKAALEVFNSLKNNLKQEIKNCSSGKELIERGFENDINLACAFNSSNNVPLLKGRYYLGTR